MLALVFIDGNNLYHNSKLMRIKLTPSAIEKLSRAVCSHFNCEYKGTIYYNSIPSIEDGEEMYYNHMKFMSNIKYLPRFTLKTRKLQRKSNKEILDAKKIALAELGLCKICHPLIESNCVDCVGDFKKREKAIDMMIGMDMLNLSLIKKECDCCILISGDADFIPVLDLIKDNGKKVYSAFLTKGYSYEIRQKHEFLIIDNQFLRKSDIL